MCNAIRFYKKRTPAGRRARLFTPAINIRPAGDDRKKRRLGACAVTQPTATTIPTKKVRRGTPYKIPSMSKSANPVARRDADGCHGNPEKRREIPSSSPMASPHHGT